MDDLGQTVDSASRGDATAIERLFADNLPRLRAFVRLRMGPELRARESTSDIVQSACREILANMGRYRYQGAAQFRHWLFTTAQRKLSNKLEFHRAANATSAVTSHRRTRRQRGKASPTAMPTSARRVGTRSDKSKSPSSKQPSISSLPSIARC